MRVGAALLWALFQWGFLVGPVPMGVSVRVCWKVAFHFDVMTSVRPLQWKGRAVGSAVRVAKVQLMRAVVKHRWWVALASGCSVLMGVASTLEKTQGRVLCSIWCQGHTCMLLHQSLSVPFAMPRCLAFRLESTEEKALQQEIAALTAKLEGPKAAVEAERTGGEAAAPAEGSLVAENGQLDDDAKKELQKQIAEKQAKLESLAKAWTAKTGPAAAKSAWGAGAAKGGPKADRAGGEGAASEAPAAKAAIAQEPASKG